MVVEGPGLENPCDSWNRVDEMSRKLRSDARDDILEYLVWLSLRVIWGRRVLRLAESCTPDDSERFLIVLFLAASKKEERRQLVCVRLFR